MSKAQVTLFIILGIIILVILSFVFYMSETIAQQKLEKPVDRIVREFIKSKAINYYVTTCLDKVSKEALILIGEQGGFIHKEQNPLIDWDIPYIEYNGKKVSYRIYNDISGAFKPENPSKELPLFYPCFKVGKGEFHTTGEECHKNYNHEKIDYSFGSTKEPQNNIRPYLCKKTINIQGAEYICDCFPPDSMHCNYSIQSQLENYTKKEIKECIDFSQIKGYEVSKGDVNVEVGFSKNNVLFKIDFPIIIKVEGSEPIIKVLEFTLPQPVRFKIIYELAQDLIDKDINDIAFDIVKDGQERANKDGNFEITRDYFDPSASIITIEDLESQLDGKNYKFMFARENRVPALDYMKFTYMDVALDFTYNGLNYDYYIIENQTLNFTPTAFDPDGHIPEKYPLEYDYIGWKGTELMDSVIYQNPRIYSDHTKDECKHPFSEVGEKHRCANYSLNKATLNDEDYCGTSVIIRAKDKGELPVYKYDYQIISVYVDDIPDTTKVEPDNHYNNIDNYKASIEDPFYIDVSIATDRCPALPPDNLKFRLWINPLNPTEIYPWTDRTVLQIPRTPFTIDNIIYRTPLTLGPQTLILDAKNKITTPIDNTAVKPINIDVHQCLPHRSLHASYPFNNIDWDDYGPLGQVVDDFQGDHACCDNNFNIYRENSKVCYQLIDYGHYSDFVLGSQYYSPGGFPAPHPGGGDEPELEYKRTLIVSCSGDRGNVCDNVVTNEIEENAYCLGGAKHSLSSCS